MFTIKKKGSVITDAAICLPIFIIAMCTVLMLIVHAGEESKSYHNMSRQALYICLAEAASGVYPQGRSVALPGGFTVDHVQTIYEVVNTKIPVPKPIRRNIAVLQHLSYRPFAGESAGNSRNDDFMVYVFERYGERYHIEGCSILKRERNRGNKEFSYMPRSEAEEKGYTQCRLCIGGEEWGFTK